MQGGGEVTESKEFNLLREAWIRVLTKKGEIQELSITDALIHAHEYQSLAGELVTQDVAVMRLLLAILQTVVYRYDGEGEEDLLEDAESAFDRWENIWQRGYFRKETIRQYLEKWEDRFWLFHPERPFYQVPEAEEGTECSAAKLNGMISESNNKIRMFSDRSGAKKAELTFPEAARWLLYLNGFDDTSAKPKKKGSPSVGVGWLGKLGLVYAEGKNLFETLMLNLVLVYDRSEVWEEPKPQWELAKPRTKERTRIPVPDNQAELLTLQSRRILLKKKENLVTGYTLLGGDYFEKENAFAEQMTVWQRMEGKKNEVPWQQPRRHSPERQMWRDFANLFCLSEGGHQPGVVEWITLLKRRRRIENETRILFKTASVKYGDKDFFAIDVFGDYLDLQADLFAERGIAWEKEIQKEVALCDQVAGIVAILKRNLNRAAGRDADADTASAREKYYYLVDQPFRRWISGISGETEIRKAGELRLQWRNEEYEMARNLGWEMFSQAGKPAMLGHEYREDKDKKEYRTSFDAWNIFTAQLKKSLEL